MNIKKNKKLRHLWLESARDTLSDTSTHAIPNILKESNHWILKIIWAICFLGCTGVCCFLIYGTFNTFFSYPSYITTQIVVEIPTKFPAVSFCNLKSVNYSNPYTLAYLTKVNTKINIVNIVNISTSSLSQNSSFADYYNLLKGLYEFASLSIWSISQEYTLRSLIANDKKLTSDTRQQLGYQIEDMIISCQFNYQKCSASDFTYIFHSQYGNCYSFNGDKYANGSINETRTTSFSGILFGLTLELFLGDPSIGLNYEPNEGILLSINNQSAEPLWQGDVLKAESGAETDFILNRNFVSKLPTPYGNCLLQGTGGSLYYDYIVNTLGRNYSQQFCFKLCIQDQINSMCGCANTFFPTFVNQSTKFCSLSNDVTCSLNVISENDLKTCQLKCPEECSYVDYEIATFKTKYPSIPYSKLLYSYVKDVKGINLSYNDISRAFTKINIYYHDMKYTTTTQVAKMDFPDLFSSFGGNLGLFLGMSFLTFVEIVEIVFNFFLILVNYVTSRRKKSLVAQEKTETS